jgi:hypothetical protein
MKIRLLLVFFLLALVLSACGETPAAPPVSNEPPPDAVATQVSLLLTATSAVFVPTTPLDTPIPQVVLPTATLEATTALPSPTQTALPPTETPSPSPTSTVFVPPTATTTPSAADPRTLLGSPTWQDKQFAENHNWGGAWDGEYTRGSFKDNRLVFTSISTDGWTLSWPQTSDFYIEMTATTGECSGNDRYGIIVRVPDTYDRGYLFGFTCDGKYSLRKWDPGLKQYVVLLAWTTSAHINPGENQTNRLGLKAIGNRFQLYANGNFLAEAFDSELNRGRFGPFIGHGPTNNFTIYVSEISYWDLAE